jgi:hypothetical protein
MGIGDRARGRTDGLAKWGEDEMRDGASSEIREIRRRVLSTSFKSVGKD